jgi:hypothetical protein
MLWFKEGDVDVLSGLLPGSPAFLRQFLASLQQKHSRRAYNRHDKETANYSLIPSRDIHIVRYLIGRGSIGRSIPLSLKDI